MLEIGNFVSIDIAGSLPADLSSHRSSRAVSSLRLKKAKRAFAAS
jgi:hypothetical protein